MSDRRGRTDNISPNPIVGAAPYQLLDFIALTHNLRGQACGETPSPYHAVISEALRSNLSELLSDLNADFKSCHDGIEAGIAMAGRGSTAVLRRPKEDIEIQAGLSSLCDIETETEQPEPKRRGRGRARPPPKKKPTRRR
jgi:hypothetical protein